MKMTREEMAIIDLHDDACRLMLQGSFSEAEEAYRKLESVLEASGIQLPLVLKSKFLSNRGLNLIYLNELDRSRSLLEEAISILEPTQLENRGPMEEESWISAIYNYTCYFCACRDKIQALHKARWLIKHDEAIRQEMLQDPDLSLIHNDL